LGAFLSGVGSVLSAWFFVKKMRKRYEKICDDRFKAFLDGMKAEREAEHQDDKN